MADTPSRAGQAHELSGRERGEPRIHVDDVAGDDDQIGTGLSDEIEPHVQIVLRHVKAHVKIADLGDGVSVESARKPGDSNYQIAELEHVAPADGSPPENSRRHTEERDAAGALDDLPPRDGLVTRLDRLFAPCPTPAREGP